MHNKPVPRVRKEVLVTVVCYYPNTLEYVLHTVPYKGTVVNTMKPIMDMYRGAERVDFVCMLNGKCTVHHDWVPHVEGVA
mgnify:FL=1